MIVIFKDAGSQDVFDGLDTRAVIRVNSQYRICFRWENGDAYEVEITDYH